MQAVKIAARPQRFAFSMKKNRFGNGCAAIAAKKYWERT
jgi:hypothetical protein